MRTLSLMLLVALPLGLGACTDDTGTETDTDTDTDSDTDTEGDTDPLPRSLTGTITDASGAPVFEANILLCNYDLCVPATTDEDGAYEFIRGGSSAGSFAFKVQSTDRPTLSTPLVIADEGERVVDVVLPDFDVSMPVPTSSTEVGLAPGLTVTMAGSDVEIPNTGQDEVVGGTLVAPEDYPPIDEEPGGTLAGLYYLEVYDAKAKAALPATFDATELGLDDGANVTVYVHSYKEYTSDEDATSQWIEVSSATVADGSFSVQLPYLATIAVYTD